MADIKVELREFISRPNGIEYTYRVYTQSHVDAVNLILAHKLKWPPGSDQLSSYTTHAPKPFLLIDRTLTTPEELSLLVNGLGTKSETILPKKVEDLGGWLILNLTSQEKTPDLDKAAITLSEAMVKEYGWSLTDAVKIFSYAMYVAIQDKKTFAFYDGIGNLKNFITATQKGYS